PLQRIAPAVAVVVPLLLAGSSGSRDVCVLSLHTRSIDLSVRRPTPQASLTDCSCWTLSPDVFLRLTSAADRFPIRSPVHFSIDRLSDRYC
ncbi:Uncharacterized protein APZ42_003733, partial [Daphnia magna]